MIIYRKHSEVNLFTVRNRNKNIFRPITCQTDVSGRERTDCVVNLCWVRSVSALILFDHAGMFWCLQSLTADDTGFIFSLRLTNIPFLLLYFLFPCRDQEAINNAWTLSQLMSACQSEANEHDCRYVTDLVTLKQLADIFLGLQRALFLLWINCLLFSSIFCLWNVKRPQDVFTGRVTWTKDLREEQKTLLEEGETLFRVTGNKVLAPIFPFPKLLWIIIFNLLEYLHVLLHYTV